MSNTRQEVSKIILEYLQELDELPITLINTYEPFFKSSRKAETLEAYSILLAYGIIRSLEKGKKQQAIASAQTRAVEEAKKNLLEASGILNRSLSDKDTNEVSHAACLNKEINRLLSKVRPPRESGQTSRALVISPNTSTGTTRTLSVVRIHRQGKDKAYLIRNILCTWWSCLDEVASVSKRHPVFRIAEVLLGGTAESNRKTYSNSYEWLRSSIASEDEEKSTQN